MTKISVKAKITVEEEPQKKVVKTMSYSRRAQPKVVDDTIHIKPEFAEPPELDDLPADGFIPDTIIENSSTVTCKLIYI